MFALLERLVELGLSNNINPIQLVIRLLIPQGSYLFKLRGFEDIVMPFDPERLGYPWSHADPRVDRLQADLEAFVAEADQKELSRRDIFTQIWEFAHLAIDVKPPPLCADFMGPAVPQMSEPMVLLRRADEPATQRLLVFRHGPPGRTRNRMGLSGGARCPYSDAIRNSSRSRHGRNSRAKPHHYLDSRRRGHGRSLTQCHV